MNLIKAERLRVGLSQNELARRSGVKQSVISDIENGKTKLPRVDTIQQIAGVLGFEWTAYFQQQKRPAQPIIAPAGEVQG